MKRLGQATTPLLTLRSRCCRWVEGGVVDGLEGVLDGGAVEGGVVDGLKGVLLMGWRGCC